MGLIEVRLAVVAPVMAIYITKQVRGHHGVVKRGVKHPFLGIGTAADFYAA